jgi:hypothetical protein
MLIAIRIAKKVHFYKAKVCLFSRKTKDKANSPIGFISYYWFLEVRSNKPD